MLLLGWGIFDNSITQSEHLRQLDLTINSTTRYDEIQTNVGPYGEDVCKGDSGEANATDFVFISMHVFMVRWTSVDAGR